MTYASYLKTKGNLARDSAIISIADFGVAFVACLVVFPIIFSFDLQDQVGASTIGALFISLPAAFLNLGAWGSVITVAFFLMLFFGALSSAISLLEVVVTAMVDHGMQRKKAAIVTGVAIAVMGIPSALNTNFLGVADQVIGNFLLITGGFFTSVLIGWKLLPLADEELAQGFDNAGARKAGGIIIKFLVPPVLLMVLIFTVAGPTYTAIVELFQ